MHKVILTMVFCVCVISKATAQGCSDAGVCTLHSIKNNGADEEEKKSSKNNVSIGFAYGIGERSTDNYTGYLEYTRIFTPKTSVTGKLSYNAINGELASTSGFGDLFLSVNHVFDTKGKWKKSFVAGVKLPFDNADIQKRGIQLPMPYQTSLGTVDLVLAINYNRKNIGATLAWQQPLKSRNGNGFLPGDYPAEPLTLKYWPTNQFSRKGDLVGRIAYTIKTGQRFSLRPGLLGIYHLANDTYQDMFKNRKPIYNSTGLTLNGTIYADYHFKNGSGLELSLGTPFVVRDQRPDGLTRKLVAGISYQFSF